MATTSVLVPRAGRLTIFFLAILLEISMAAFFFDLQPAAYEEDKSLLQETIENFWVGLYSVVFAAIPMLLVGCLLAYPLRY